MPIVALAAPGSAGQGESREWSMLLLLLLVVVAAVMMMMVVLQRC